MSARTSRFDGSVVAITGAGSGIGRALALDLAQRGARLSVSDVDESGLAETVDLLTRVTDPHHARVDVSDLPQMREYAATVAAHFGEVNVIINNAGVTYSGPIERLEYSDFHWLMNINFWGVVHGTKEFLPYLTESATLSRRRGHIVNISSLFGLLSVPSQAAYNAAKFAVRGFTEAVRQDQLVAGVPIDVTCVHPGGVRTGIARNGRGAPGEDREELARHFEEDLARLSPERAAAIIVRAMERRRPRVLVGADAHLLHNLAKFLGAGYQDLVAKRARAGRL